MTLSATPQDKVTPSGVFTDEALQLLAAINTSLTVAGRRRRLQIFKYFFEFSTHNTQHTTHTQQQSSSTGAQHTERNLTVD